MPTREYHALLHGAMLLCMLRYSTRYILHKNLIIRNSDKAKQGFDVVFTDSNSSLVNL